MPDTAAVSRGFQVFVKPAGAACNLGCRYCYYLGKPGPETDGRPQPVPGWPAPRPRPADRSASNAPPPPRMSLDLLEEYIGQHFAASADEVVRFSWHGGEPTIAGIDFFRRIVDLQRRLCPAGRTVANGLQTNGTLLDQEWGEFLAAERFAVGLSLDGPRDVHDQYRLARDGSPSFEAAVRGCRTLAAHGVPVDILCVVGAHNVRRAAEVYGFFKAIGASDISFLPLVERRRGAPAGVSPASVPAEAWGDFLCAVFEEWLAGDIGRVKVQLVEEAARTAFGQEHSLCIFRPVCGDIPVLERNGDLYSCDHFVDAAHRLGNLRETPLAALLESPAQRSFGRAKLESLPRACRECDVLEMCHGECPKNRFVPSAPGEPPLNYLCPGYRKFFRRVRPFVAAVGAEWRRQKTPDTKF